MAVTPLFQVFRRPWPGIMRTVFKNHECFENTYFKKFPGFYVTGDGEIQESALAGYHSQAEDYSG